MTIYGCIPDLELKPSDVFTNLSDIPPGNQLVFIARVSTAKQKNNLYSQVVVNIPILLDMGYNILGVHSFIINGSDPDYLNRLVEIRRRYVTPYLVSEHYDRFVRHPKFGYTRGRSPLILPSQNQLRDIQHRCKEYGIVMGTILDTNSPTYDVHQHRTKRGRSANGKTLMIQRRIRRGILLPIILNMRNMGFTQEEISHNLRIPIGTIALWCSHPSIMDKVRAEVGGAPFATVNPAQPKSVELSRLHRPEGNMESLRFLGFQNYSISRNGVICEQVGGNMVPIDIFLDRTGYLTCNLVYPHGESRIFFVHQLVLYAFIGAKPSKYCICRHLNGVPTDNRVENLAWGTYKENAQDTLFHKNQASFISKESKVSIINELGYNINRDVSYLDIDKVAIKHGISRWSVCRIICSGGKLQKPYKPAKTKNKKKTVENKKGYISLTKETAETIRHDYLTGTRSCKELAKTYGLSQLMIFRIAEGKQKRFR